MYRHPPIKAQMYRQTNRPKPKFIDTHPQKIPSLRIKNTRIFKGKLIELINKSDENK